jgi:oligosaccharyltransferase complex subunit delta (ribophorin II)
LQFLRKDTVLSAYLILASTGDADGYYERAFSVGVKADPTATTGSTEKPLRYGKLPEIHHIFRSDPKSPNFVIVAFFTVAAAATLPVLLGLVSLCPSSNSVSEINPLAVAASRRKPESSF